MDHFPDRVTAARQIRRRLPHACLRGLQLTRSFLSRSLLGDLTLLILLGSPAAVREPVYSRTTTQGFRNLS